MSLPFMDASHGRHALGKAAQAPFPLFTFAQDPPSSSSPNFLTHPHHLQHQQQHHHHQHHQQQHHQPPDQPPPPPQQQQQQHQNHHQHHQQQQGDEDLEHNQTHVASQMDLVCIGQNSGYQENFHQSENHNGNVHEDEADCPQMEDEDDGRLNRLDQSASQQKKEFKRSWREEWKIRHKWVYPIKKESGELRLKCHWCTIFNMDSVFAKEGCSTIQMSALTTHAKSEAHKIAESRWESCDMSLTTLDVPENLWDLGDQKFANSSDAGDADGGETAEDGEPHTRFSGRKRKFSMLNKGETLGSIMQKNNSRVVEVLLDAEKGRNKRHATDVALAKRHFQLEEQKIHIEQQRLEFEKMRFEGTMALGQGYITALTNIGNGLMKIGNAMEAFKKI